MSYENKVSTREYWLDRIDEVCDGERRRLLAKDRESFDDKKLREAAVRSLGITRLLSRRNAAEKRVAEASATVSKVDVDIAKAIGIESQGWGFQNALRSKIEQEREEVTSWPRGPPRPTTCSWRRRRRSLGTRRPAISTPSS